MKLLLVPKPVLSNKMTVLAYCFRYQKIEEMLAGQSARAFDGIFHSPCLEVLNMVGLDAFTNGRPIFVPINKFTLLTDLENKCADFAHKTIFLLNDSIPPEDLYIDSIKRLKTHGFRFALENISNYTKMNTIVELSDFIFISHDTANCNKIIFALKHRYNHLSYVATDVNTINVFNSIKYEIFDFFDGIFYTLPLTTSYNTISPMKVNYIQLLNIVREEDFSIEEVAKIVAQDIALSISLLKLVNSPYIGITSKIKTIGHAVAMLGQNELKKWVVTALAGNLATDKPDEVTKLSLMRAKFAENLAKEFDLVIQNQSLFLMGLFSVLDVVLEMPIESALKIIVVSDKIYDALVSMEGEYAKVLNFIYKYESADWNEVFRLMVINNLKPENVFNAYIEAAKWYGSVISKTT